METTMAQTVRELIEEALVEARIMESARETFSKDNMLLTAMRLSGAPFSFVQMIYEKEAA